jgi:adenylyltransferase and sulfurtransferase
MTDFHNSSALQPQKIMDAATESAETLRQQIAATETELKRLKEQLASVEAQNAAKEVQKSLEGLLIENQGSPVTFGKWPLSSEEYKRYGRQMIVPNIGIQGQILRVLSLSKIEGFLLKP